jgi:hypothetical protein
MSGEVCRNKVSHPDVGLHIWAWEKKIIYKSIIQRKMFVIKILDFDQNLEIAGKKASIPRC